MVDFNRQINLFNPSQFDDREVTVIGLGNIGSHAALTLARMGIKKFCLFDADTIEEHNLSSQSYGAAELGMAKVQAVGNQINAIGNGAIIFMHQEVFSVVGDLDIVLVAVDSLEARRQIGELLKAHPPKLILDGRIGGEQMELYTFEKVEDWQASIPESGSEEPCGARYIAYVSVMIGGLIACQVKKYLTEQKLDKSILVHVPTMQVIKNYEW